MGKFTYQTNPKYHPPLVEGICPLQRKNSSTKGCFMDVNYSCSSKPTWMAPSFTKGILQRVHGFPRLTHLPLPWSGNLRWHFGREQHDSHDPATTSHEPWRCNDKEPVKNKKFYMVASKHWRASQKSKKIILSSKFRMEWACFSNKLIRNYISPTVQQCTFTILQSS